MTRLLNGAIVVLGLAGATLVVAGPVSAATVGNSFDDAAFGYQDGYWDHSDQWHDWRNQDEAVSYKNTPGSQYYAYPVITHSHYSLTFENEVPLSFMNEFPPYQTP